ncbi:MAG TPA: hypothetical protein ENN17_10020 [bacterium]|nr:hypothetical protein [bacterium]
MKRYLFADQRQQAFLGNSGDHLLEVLDHVAAGTNTRDLVAALYLVPGKNRTRGTAFVQAWISADRFIATRGFWTFGSAYGIPGDLPDRFKLIRLRIDADPCLYPRHERDIYDWEFCYPDLEDHLATLFAHELHHYRRHHLGLHPREGEQAANRWALDRIRTLGYRADGKKMKPVLNKKPLQRRIRDRFAFVDPFAPFRTLRSGNLVLIRRDPTGRYAGEPATVVRPIRSQSKRIVIQTGDGRQWRWPMRWLDIPGRTNL